MNKKIQDFKNWLIVNGYSNLTYYHRIREFYKKVKTLNITKEIIDNFILNNRQYSAESLNCYLKAIKAFMRFRKKEISLPNLFKTKKMIPNFIKLEFLEKEILPLISDLYSNLNPLKIKSLLLFMFFTGIRKGELMYLKRKDINLNLRRAKIYSPKTKSEKQIPIPKNLIFILEEYFNSEKEITNCFNLNKGTINYLFQILKTNFKEKNLHPHLFRSSFATHLSKKGFNIFEIQYLMGHKNLASTQRYVNVNIDDLQEKYNERIK